MKIACYIIFITSSMTLGIILAGPADANPSERYYKKQPNLYIYRSFTSNNYNLYFIGCCLLYSKPQREIRLYLKRVVSGRTRAIVTLIIFRNDRIGRVKSGHDNKMLRCIIFQENYIFIKLVIIHSS